MNFFLLLIYFFIKQIISVQINNTRLEGAIKYAISSFDNIPNIPIKNESIIFKYEKYKIIYSNFRIISPNLNEISINISVSPTDNESYIYYFENLKFAFVFDIKISHYLDFFFEETDNFLEINCSIINYKYNLKHDFLTFNSIELSDFRTFHLNSDTGFYILDYYKDAREKKKCLCKFESEKNYIEEFPEIYMIRFIKYLISYYISEIELNDILLTYDIKMIFANTLVILNNLDSNKLDYIKINRILVPFDKIETVKYDKYDRKITIHQIKFIGTFNLTKFNKEYEFSFELNDENNNRIELYNRQLNFTFKNIIIETNFAEKNINKTEIIEALKSAVFNNYSKVLIESNKKYFIDNIIN